MIEIKLTKSNSQRNLSQLSDKLEGILTEEYGEQVITINNHIGEGKIRFIEYDFGVDYLDYDIIFFEEIKIITSTINCNPINFSYCQKGSFIHYYKSTPELLSSDVKQFQSVVSVGKEDDHKIDLFPKDSQLAISIIHINRINFLTKKSIHTSLFNGKLAEIFLDIAQNYSYRFCGTFDLKIGAKMSEIKLIQTKGLARLLEIEGIVYQVLSIHIVEHNNSINHQRLESTLLREELEIISNLAKTIKSNLSEAYNIEMISLNTGLSEAKLQEGFKHLFNNTVIKQIREFRLIKASNYLKNGEMNISDTMYSVGFSSRSYFSKIFTEKYGINPRDYLKKVNKT